MAGSILIKTPPEVVMHYPFVLLMEKSEEIILMGWITRIVTTYVLFYRSSGLAVDWLKRGPN